MRIKRVAIQGFKTFANKTELVFDAGTTAIVGPNGSGKSNIVDAVRWCLGEQSFSQLRSKKTSDIIFSGSDKRARLGMAQVSLTLDNSNGEMPIDFDEVEITRRAYRDGGNDYLINGQKVRLLDVTEMLSYTGLGKRTYAVVGQGLIDRVLRLSAEERRALFEEAAGITTYQTKRTKTIRQLDATQQNLTRVQDIMNELSPRLNYLRRQAERARERDQIAQDLHELLKQWYGYRWHAAKNQLEQSQLGEGHLKGSVAERQKALTDIGTRIENLRTEQSTLRTNLGTLHHASSELHTQAEKVTRDLAVSQERLRQTQDRQEEAQRELAPLRLQTEGLQERLATLITALAEAKSLYDERQKAVEVLQRELTSRQKERQESQNVLDAARNHLNQLRNQQADSESRLEQIAERRAAIHIEQQNQNETQKSTQGQADAIQEELTKAAQILSEKEEEVSERQAKIQELEDEAKTLRGELQQAQETRQAADRAADQLQTRYDLLVRLRNEGAGYASGVRNVLQAASGQAKGKNGGQTLTGILGTMASLVDVPTELSKAVETALGGAFQNIVTERWDDARKAIDMLKNSGGGRATFLPLDRLNVLPPIEAPNMAGILGNASRLVQYEQPVEDAVRSLLGRVWIAETLDAARKALDQIGRGPRPTVVTVDGEIVRPGGAVSGGRDGNRRDDTVLSRERELRDLPAQIETGVKKAADLANACRELSITLEKSQSKGIEIQQSISDRRREERQQREQVEEIRRRLDRTQQAVAWNTERLEQTKVELATLEEQEAKQSDRLKDLQTRQEDGVNKLDEAERNLEAADAGDLLAKLADIRTSAAEALGNLRSQQTLEDNQRRNYQGIVDQIAGKETRIIALQKEGEELVTRIDELGTEEERLGVEIAAYQTKVDPAEARLSELEKGQEEEEKKERELQEVLRQDETSWNAAQLKLQRAEDTLVRLRYDIEQDFGLVQFQESDDTAYQPPLPLETIVEQLPVVEELPEGLGKEVKEMRARLNRVSGVNPEAPREYEEASERHEFLLTQSTDLESAIEDLREVIKELDELMEVELSKTFKAVAIEFVEFFKMLFKGGTAKLVLTTPDDITNTGIDIVARPPGKRPTSLALLSGGERSLSACALIFAILRVSPTPFCVLDEVDAALDEANVDRFRQTVETLTDTTQFIIVTHNRRTLEGANAIYGITMGNDGVSKMISLRLDGDKIVKNEEISTGSEGDTKSDAAQLKAVEQLVQM